MLSLLETKEKY